MDVLVSIIIPSFNSAPWICDAVDCSLNQTYKNCEILVIDDGSTDNTWEVLQEKYGHKIKYIYQENRGPSSARNTGIRNASGHYLQFLDADDEITPFKIEKQVNILEQHKEYDVAYSDFEYFETETAITTSSPPHYRDKYQNGDLRNSFLTGNFIVIHSVLAKKKGVVEAGSFDESSRMCEDYDLWMRMAGHGNKFVYTNGVMARYRLTPGSLSSARTALIRGTIHVVLKNLNEFRTHDTGEKNSARTYIATLHTELGSIYRSQGQLIKAIIHFFYAVHFAPWRWRMITKSLLIK